MHNYFNTIFFIAVKHSPCISQYELNMCIKAIRVYLNAHPITANLIKEATHSCAYMPHASKKPQIWPFSCGLNQKYSACHPIDSDSVLASHVHLKSVHCDYLLMPYSQKI